jgi:hypothetical protein
MVSVQSTLASTATSPPITPLASLIANSTHPSAKIISLTESQSIPWSTRILQVVGHVDRSFSTILNRYILRSFGFGIADPAVGQVAMAEAVVPGAPATVGLMGGFGNLLSEAFEAGTLRSYWGMLHYLTSRWAFTCFTMVTSQTRQNQPMLTPPGSHSQPHYHLRRLKTKNHLQLA